MAKRDMARPKRDRVGRALRKRQFKPLVLFAAEGETEREYIKALIAIRYGDRLAYRFASTRGRTDLANLIRDLQNLAYAEGTQAKGAWVVCDVDKNACHRKKLDGWLKKTPLNHIALSHPCVEYWFVLHFKSTSSSQGAPQAVRELGAVWPGGATYKKGAPITAELINATNLAITRAVQRRQSLADDADVWNSVQWTDMPELIAWLDQLDPQSGVSGSAADR